MEDTVSNLYLMANILKRDTIEKDMPAQTAGIPTACRERFLSKDDKRIYNEHKNWVENLKENAPIWSRVKYFNCMGVERNSPNSKENHYDIEIPQRLLSLWGNSDVHKSVAEKMEKFSCYQYVCNILAICACLKYNLDRWSPAVLDTIAKSSTKVYPDLLRKGNISDDEFRMNHLNFTYKLEDSKYQVKMHQVAVGSLYVSYGLNEFNLARALCWFFKAYQFGLIKCQNRCLAFGYAVDMEQGYFMYDCQSSGLPLFKINASNSYVLRSNHLQVLLYCLILSLGMSQDAEKFTIYNVDALEEETRPKPTPIKEKTRAPLHAPKHSTMNAYRLNKKISAQISSHGSNMKKKIKSVESGGTKKKK